jgi:hypothetical protein
MLCRLALGLACAAMTLGHATTAAAELPLSGKLAHGSWAGSNWRIGGVSNRIVFTLSRAPSATDPGLNGTVSLWRVGRRHTASGSRPFAVSPSIGPSPRSWTSQALAPGYYLVAISLQPISEPGEMTIIDWVAPVVYVPHSRPSP